MPPKKAPTSRKATCTVEDLNLALEKAADKGDARAVARQLALGANPKSLFIKKRAAPKRAREEDDDQPTSSTRNRRRTAEPKSFEWKAPRQSPHILKMLLNHGLDPMERDKNGNTLIHCVDHESAQQTYYVLMSRSNCSDLNPKNNAGHTPFIHLLLKSRSPYRKGMERGFTLAHMNNINLCIELLLCHGADPSATDPETGETGMHLACRCFGGRLVRYMTPEAMRTHTVTDYEVELEYALRQKDTPKKKGAKGKCVDKETAEVLRPPFIDLRLVKDNDGRYPIHIAAEVGEVNYEALNILLDSGDSEQKLKSSQSKRSRKRKQEEEDEPNMSIDHLDEDGFTPLHHAAMHGRHITAAILVKRGAYAGDKNYQNKTPYDLAYQFHTGDQLNYLIMALDGDLEIIPPAFSL